MSTVHNNIPSTSPSTESLTTMLQNKCLQALALHQKGQLVEAQKIYLDILQIQPEHADALHLLGMIAYQNKDFQRAVDLISQAIKTNANQAMFHLNCGSAFLGLKQPQAAIESYDAAIAIKPNYFEAYASRGGAMNELKQFDAAIASCNIAISLNPNYANAYCNRGNAQQLLGQLNAATNDFNKAIALSPNFADAHYNLANALKEMLQVDAAIASYNKTILLQPENGDAYNSLGVLLALTDKYEEAIVCLTKAAQLKAKKFKRGHLLQCVYRIKNKTFFDKQLKQFKLVDHLDPLAASLISHAEIRYGKTLSNLFCQNPMDFVQLSRLNAQDGLTDDLVQQSIKYISGKNHPKREQPLLNGGVQTAGNIFKTNLEFVSDLKQIILRKLDSYKETNKNSDCGLIQYWPNDFELYGWLVSMKDGGNLSSHIHMNAWVSGCLYLSVPDKDKSHSGDIMFSLDGAGYDTEGKFFPSKIVEVKEKDIALFPSSLFHSTIPFSGQKNRICLAFDMRPVGGTTELL